MAKRFIDAKIKLNGSIIDVIIPSSAYEDIKHLIVK